MRKWFFILFFALPVYGQTPQEAGLQDVQSVLGRKVFVRLRYATQNNFTGEKIYNFQTCYLLPEAVEGLKQAVELAAQQEEPFTFCLWDCYRPPQAQRTLWQVFPSANYVAPPTKGSRHSRGMAVDLTPCDFTGKPWQMPTDFDTFTPLAHMDNFDAPAKLLRRRAILKKIMIQAGFTPTRTEWWHFDKTGWQKKPLLDVVISSGETK